MIALPYGSVPYLLDLPGAEVLELPALGPPPPLRELLRAALREPFDAAPLHARRPRRVTVIVSDTTRDEPRDELLDAILDDLGPAHVTVAIATGTHGPCGLVPRRRVDAIVDHDGHRDDDLVHLGVTPRGTPVRVHRAVVETDLVIATGCIRPHYFAGFGAGIKAVFPGLGAAHDIRVNHRLKTEPRARAGIVDGNPCREDMEAAVGLLATPLFLVNGVCGPDNEIRAVVAGDVRAAFRAGVALARPWFTIPSATARTVIGSDPLPVAASLYQASKIAAALAPLVEPDGVIILAAECGDGVGPLDVVNHAIYDIGIKPRLPPGARVTLVSSIERAIVEQTYAGWAARVEDAVLPGRVLVVPRASHVIVDPT